MRNVFDTFDFLFHVFNGIKVQGVDKNIVTVFEFSKQQGIAIK